MKKRVLMAVGLIVGLLALGLPVSSAPLALPGTVTSGFQVMNIDPTAASVTVRYVPVTGAEVVQGPLAIAPGSSANFFGPTMGVAAPFTGSVVVESTQRVAAITNLVTSAPNTSGAYNGVLSPGTSLVAPLIMKANNGVNTELHIQNAGTAAATIAVEFRAAGGAPIVVTSPAPVAPGARWTLEQATMPQLPVGFVGSAVITSAQPLAAIVTQANGTMLLVYSAQAAGASTIYAPLVQNNNGGVTTGLQLFYQSGPAAGTVSIEINGVAHSSFPMSPGESRTIYPVVFAGAVGSAKITGPAGSVMYGIVNQVALAANQGMAYTMFSTGTPWVVAPLLMTNNRGWYTGFQVQNVGNANATIDLKVNGAVVPGTTRILAPAASTTYFPIPGTPAGFVGAGEVLSTTPGAQLVGVVNEMCFITAPGQACAVGDNGLTYEGINPQ